MNTTPASADHLSFPLDVHKQRATKYLAHLLDKFDLLSAQDQAPFCQAANICFSILAECGSLAAMLPDAEVYEEWYFWMVMYGDDCSTPVDLDFSTTHIMRAFLQLLDHVALETEHELLEKHIPEICSVLWHSIFHYLSCDPQTNKFTLLELAWKFHFALQDEEFVGAEQWIGTMADEVLAGNIIDSARVVSQKFGCYSALDLLAELRHDPSAEELDATCAPAGADDISTRSSFGDTDLQAAGVQGQSPTAAGSSCPAEHPNLDVCNEAQAVIRMTAQSQEESFEKDLQPVAPKPVYH